MTIWCWSDALQQQLWWNQEFWPTRTTRTKPQMHSWQAQRRLSLLVIMKFHAVYCPVVQNQGLISACRQDVISSFLVIKYVSNWYALAVMDVIVQCVLTHKQWTLICHKFALLPLYLELPELTKKAALAKLCVYDLKADIENHFVKPLETIKVHTRSMAAKIVINKQYRSC